MTVNVIRSRRKTLSLQIREDGGVVVRAPYYVREKEIRSFIQGHMDWIVKQQSKMAKTASAREQIVPLTDAELQKLAKEARVDLTARTAFFAPQIGVTYGRISIRHQKTKWGSCSSKGNLNFNCLLMLAPESVRDYVVVHELCHRKQMNHSHAFWEEVERILPHYQSAKQWLKIHGQELMLLNAGR